MLRGGIIFKTMFKKKIKVNLGYYFRAHKPCVCEPLRGKNIDICFWRQV